MSERVLTIAMAVHDDPRGVWMTCQWIRDHYPSEVLKTLEFLVLDNNPRSEKGKATRNYVVDKFNMTECPGYYLSVEPRKGTAIRNMLVQASNTEYVMMVDSHIHIFGLDKVIHFLKYHCNRTGDLFHGILQDENRRVIGTHQNPGLRGGMFGTWGIYPETKELRYADMEVFEIPLHGCGLMLFRRDNWPGFHIGFSDFGGEEGYIHEKYRLLGNRCWTLPFLRWNHHFGHPGGTTYPLTHEGKYRNHLIGWTELGLDVELVHHYFGSRVLPENRAKIREEVEALNIRALPRGNVQPFMGYPIRVNDMPPHESEDYRPFEKLVFAHE